MEAGPHTSRATLHSVRSLVWAEGTGSMDGHGHSAGWEDGWRDRVGGRERKDHLGTGKGSQHRC